jgi:hypothetical protein
MTNTVGPGSDSTRLATKFEITAWDEKPYLELDDGRKFTRARVTYVIDAGELEGEATAESLMYYDADGHSTYTGLTHVTGRLGEREGSFAFSSTGYFDGTTASSTSEVVADSGTGGFAGVRGTAESSSTHDDYPYQPITLVLEFPPSVS